MARTLKKVSEDIILNQLDQTARDRKLGEVQLAVAYIRDGVELTIDDHGLGQIQIRVGDILRFQGSGIDRWLERHGFVEIP